MSDQKQFWEREFKSKNTFPGIHKDNPSLAVIEFEKRLVKIGSLKKSKILDVGCGNGRNAIYLAQKGYLVNAIDFSKNAIALARKKVSGLKIIYKVFDIGKPWTIFNTKSFDAILDVNATICIEELGRKKAISEAYRVLKKGGYYLFCGIGRTDWVDKEPGPEINSTVFSESGKFEKQYTKEELLKAYSKFSLIKYQQKLIHSESINGKALDFSAITVVFQKTSD